MQFTTFLSIQGDLPLDGSYAILEKKLEEGLDM